MKTLHFELATPNARVYRGDVRTITMPAWNGAMGVLPGHAPYLSLLVPGHVTAKFAGRAAEQGPRLLTFHITGGYVEVLPDRVTVLADDATAITRQLDTT